MHKQHTLPFDLKTATQIEVRRRQGEPPRERWPTRATKGDVAEKSRATDERNRWSEVESVSSARGIERDRSRRERSPTKATEEDVVEKIRATQKKNRERRAFVEEMIQEREVEKVERPNLSSTHSCFDRCPIRYVPCGGRLKDVLSVFCIFHFLFSHNKAKIHARDNGALSTRLTFYL